MREMDVTDIKYLWPDYKSGNTVFKEGMTPQEFQQVIGDHVTANYDFAHIIEAPTEKGVMPVGILFSVYMGPFLSPVDTSWFPWASKRNKVEGMIHYLNEMRKEYLLIGYCSEQDKPFFEYIARHGIIRRVGKITGIYEHEDAPLFQSRGV